MRKLLRNIPITQNAQRGCDQMHEEYAQSRLHLARKA